MLYGQREFNCKLFIPDLDELVMEGNGIVLPPHVVKKLDELAARKDDNKASVRYLAQVIIKLLQDCLYYLS